MSATAVPGAGAGERLRNAPVVIEARGIEKTFRIPHHRVDSLKERATHPFAARGHNELHALRGVSFDVHRGEFFGIVGRNGSGKSTLLKIMSSIYRADRGTIRMAGRLAPFIELGVGFNPELAARDNVVLNGVLMGLSPREGRRRFDAVLEFAGLRDVADLKLKNYSSGMMVRLAFAVMVEADADIMLIDEVLAVGDAAFAQKCADVFHAKRRAGRTVVLVTHDMGAVQDLCDRALVIEAGELRHVGDPEEVARHYYRLNFAGAPGEPHRSVAPMQAKVVEAWLEDAEGSRVQNVAEGAPLGFRAVIEAIDDVEGPLVSLDVVNTDQVKVFGLQRPLGGAERDSADDRIAAGQRVRIAGTIENPLLPGRYSIELALFRHHTRGDIALRVERLVEFVVYGPGSGSGSVAVKADLEVGPEPGGAS